MRRPRIEFQSNVLPCAAVSEVLVDVPLVMPISVKLGLHALSENYR